MLKLRSDGSRIDTQNIGKKPHKKIGIQYGLIKAENYRKEPVDLKAIVLQKYKTER